MSRGMEIFQLHEEGIEEALRRCHDPGTIVDVARAVVNAQAQVWGDERALVITQLVPETRTVHFWVATGELDAVLAIIPGVMEWARSLGYDKGSLIGRRGWVRVLAREGWREQAVIMGRDI